MSQNDMILSYLLEGNAITSLEALSMFNCLRLSARIYDLKLLGYPVLNTLIRTNSGKTVASYYINVKDL